MKWQSIGNNKDLTSIRGNLLEEVSNLLHNIGGYCRDIMLKLKGVYNK